MKFLAKKGPLPSEILLIFMYFYYFFQFSLIEDIIGWLVMVKFQALLGQGPPGMLILGISHFYHTFSFESSEIMVQYTILNVLGLICLFSGI